MKFWDARVPENGLYRESTINTHIFVTPDPRLAHRADQIGASEKHNADVSMFAVLSLHTSSESIDFIFKMVEHNSGALIGLESFP
jgi:hypothetical protein